MTNTFYDKIWFFLVNKHEIKITMDFFLNVFTELSEFTENKFLYIKGIEPATSSVRDQDATTVPARRM